MIPNDQTFHPNDQTFQVNSHFFIVQGVPLPNVDRPS